MTQNNTVGMPTDRLKCPKCGSEHYYIYPEEGMPFRKWRCSKCGHEEKVKP